MKIIDIITADKPSLSFEVFPPKTSDKFENVKHVTEEIAKLSPSYMSVTYGAGGGTSEFTTKIASNLQNNFSVPTLAHLSCISSNREMVDSQLKLLRENHIENILALRGDIPEGFDESNLDYHFASELVTQIKEFGGFCIGGACYPESHPDSESSFSDIENLKKKVDCGCDFLTTQMFFDNNILYNFLYRIRERGINVPIVAGIMPVTNASSIKRICRMNNSLLPQRFVRIVDKFGTNPKMMVEAGIAYATEQVVDLLANGINAIHIYTMNKPYVAKKIQDNVKNIMGIEFNEE